MFYTVRPQKASPLNFVVPSLHLSRLEQVSLALLAAVAVGAATLDVPPLLKVGLSVLALGLTGGALFEGRRAAQQQRARQQRVLGELRAQLPYGWTMECAELKPSGEAQHHPATAVYVVSPDDNAYLLLLPDTAFTPFHRSEPQDQLVDHAGQLLLTGESHFDVQFRDVHRSRMRLVLGFGPEVPSFRLGQWTVSVAPVAEQVSRLRAWEEMALNEYGPSARRVPPACRSAPELLADGHPDPVHAAAVEQLTLSLGSGWIISTDVLLRCGERCDALLTRLDGERFAVRVLSRQDSPSCPDHTQPRFWTQEFILADTMQAPLGATPVLWQPLVLLDQYLRDASTPLLVRGDAGYLASVLELPANWTLQGGRGRGTLPDLWTVFDTSVEG